MRSSLRTAVAGPALVTLLLVTGCGSGGSTSAGDSGGPTTTEPPGTTVPSPPVSYDPQQRYEVDGTVLEDARHGPELCFAVLESYPPQCGGLPVKAFSWSDAPAASVTRSGKVTWAELHLVGTYDGTSFTLTGPPTAGRGGSPTPDPNLAAPCPAPAGGWKVVDPAKIGQSDFAAVQAEITRQADYVIHWVDRTHRVAGGHDQFSSSVLVAAFTGDVDRHRAEIAARWGGATCVVPRARSNRDVEAARSRIEPKAPAHAPIGIVSSGISVRDGDVSLDLTVVVDNASVRAWVQARAGGVPVHIEGRLRPVTDRGGN